MAVVGRNDIIRWLLDHRTKVSARLSSLGNDLAIRGRRHDNSYSDPVEVGMFEKFYNIGAGDAEKDKKRERAVELVNGMHEKRNFYLPGFFANGIHDMDMLELIEYICDRITLWEEFKAGNLSPANYGLLKDEESRNDIYQYILSELPDISDDLKAVVRNTTKFVLNRNEVLQELIRRENGPERPTAHVVENEEDTVDGKTEEE